MLGRCKSSKKRKKKKKRIPSGQSWALVKTPAHIMECQLSSTSASLQQGHGSRSGLSDAGQVPLLLARSTSGTPPPTSLFSITILLTKQSHFDVARTTTTTLASDWWRRDRPRAGREFLLVGSERASLARLPDRWIQRRTRARGEDFRRLKALEQQRRRSS